MTQLAQEADQLQEGRYSPRELKLLLTRKRQKRIPHPTWQRWKKELDIHPDDQGQYWEEDRQALEGLIVALKAGWTIARYKQHYLEAQANANRIWQNESTASASGQSIDVSAIAC
jgi:hypothetical protein